MPTSNFDKIPATIKAVEVLAPKSILDIGIGFGKYGALLREKLDVSLENIEREDWKLRIDGVEGFPKYRSPLWDCYDEVFIGRAEELVSEFDPYDLVLMLDVIEHFTKESGFALIDELLQKCGAVIVTTPCDWHAQKDWGGNDLETHRSHWTENDFSKYRSLCMVVGDNCLMAIIVSKQEQLDRCRLSKYPICRRKVSLPLLFRIKKRLLRLFG